MHMDEMIHELSQALTPALCAVEELDALARRAEADTDLLEMTGAIMCGLRRAKRVLDAARAASPAWSGTIAPKRPPSVWTRDDDTDGLINGCY